MSPTFEYDFSSNAFGFKGKSSFSTGLFINNEYVDSVSNETLDVITPMNGKTVGKISLTDAKDVDVAVAAAKRAYETSWGQQVPALERGKLLFKLADLIEQNADELAALESLDTGKPLKFARHADVHYAMVYLRYYAGWADKISGKTIETKDSKLTYTRYEPIGVCGLIVPWNLPFMNASWKLGPALATGNTVVLKPSELTSLTTLRLGALIKEAGFPPGVVNIVPGYGWTAGAAISSHMDIGKISFTGSTNAGRQVMKAAAESNLKKVSLEMGGKGPALVMDDAHLEDALKWTAFGMMYNQGQICYACSRVYVHESVYDLFLSYYKHIMNSFPIGDPFSPTTFNGPVASEAHFNRIMQYIEIGKKEGATLLAGGERWGTEGFFIKPTVFADVTPEMTIVKEEIFGPVVVVAKYKTEEELIKLANDSEFGLTAAVFSRDVTKAITTANAIQAGTVWVNMAGLPDPSMPFGGYKQSGIGRDFGEEALYSYLETKSVHVNLTNKPPF